jgi:hypothetical protein
LVGLTERSRIGTAGRALVFAVVVGLWAAPVAAGSPATVSVESKEIPTPQIPTPQPPEKYLALVVTAVESDPTAHDVNVSFDGEAYRVTDSAGVTAGVGCSQIDQLTARCADAADLTVVEIAAGAGDDRMVITGFGPALAALQTCPPKGPAEPPCFRLTTMRGEGGADEIHAPSIPNLIRGGTGRDTLLGSPGRDLLTGNNGRDIVLGLEGNDEVRGGSNKDRVDGGLGNDILEGGGSSDLIIGGPGRDKAVRVAPGLGRDRFRGVEVKHYRR